MPNFQLKQPTLLSACIEYLKTDLDNQELFPRKGFDQTVEIIINNADEGILVDLRQWSVVEISRVLERHLDTIEEPLLDGCSILERSKSGIPLENSLALLSTEKIEALALLLPYLNELDQHRDCNNITARTLAEIFTPVLLGTFEDGDWTYAVRIVEALILNPAICLQVYQSRVKPQLMTTRRPIITTTPSSAATKIPLTSSRSRRNSPLRQREREETPRTNQQHPLVSYVTNFQERSSSSSSSPPRSSRGMSPTLDAESLIRKQLGLEMSVEKLVSLCLDQGKQLRLMAQEIERSQARYDVHMQAAKEKIEELKETKSSLEVQLDEKTLVLEKAKEKIIALETEKRDLALYSGRLKLSVEEEQTARMHTLEEIQAKLENQRQLNIKLQQQQQK